jgi:pimeloyl-ACP methyl ester carboxylesterase
MNDPDELKQFIEVHARGQKIGHFREILGRIENDGEGPGSWTGEWSAAGARLEQRGKLLPASRHYAMAHFPFVNGTARREAHERCVRVFEQWGAAHGLQSLELFLDGRRLRCWAGGLSSRERLPLLVIMGGIVTLKEQWAPLLTRLRFVGMAGIVVEMPGVGENELSYGPESWQMLSGLLDAVSDRADVSRTYAMALSFSGHLALRCAGQDSRILGIFTASAPVRDFFADPAWRPRIPRLTVDTLAHLCGAAAPFDDSAWVLGDDELAALRVPVAYVVSQQDEIIPASDPRRLARLVSNVEFLVHDDVHGAPRHIIDTQLWGIRALFRMSRPRTPASAAVGLLWRTRRLIRNLG